MSYQAQSKLSELQAAMVLPLGRSTSTPVPAGPGRGSIKTIPSPVSCATSNEPRGAGDNSCIFGRVNLFKTDFSVRELVGQGGFGRIYKCKSKLDGRWYAVKLEQFWFKPQAFFNPSEVREVMLNEALMLSQLDHENVCRYYNTWVTGSLVAIDKVGKQVDVITNKSPTLEGAQRRTSQTRRVSSSSNFTSFVTAAPRFIPAKPEVYDDESDDEDDTEDDDDSVLDTMRRSDLEGLDDLPGFDDLGFDLEEAVSDTTQATLSVSDVTATAPHVPRRRLQSLDITGSAGGLCTQIDVYIQMALYDGDSLQHWLEHRTVIDPAATLNIFRQIVAGLKYVHGQGLIHRDIKPANVFLTKDSTVVKIGDFGLAKNTIQSSLHIPPTEYYFDDGSMEPEANAPTASVSAGVGTPLYSSPEQVAGQPCDSSTDIFSLGVLLCELFLTFSTQMERCLVLSSLHKGVIPTTLQHTYPAIASLVEQMVQHDSNRRLSCDQLEAFAIQHQLWSPHQSTLPSWTPATPTLTQASTTASDATDAAAAMTLRLKKLVESMGELEEAHDGLLRNIANDLDVASSTIGLLELAEERRWLLRALYDIALHQ